MVEADDDHQRWRERPHAARAVRLAILAVPLAACVACSILLSRALPRATTFWGSVLWWLLVVGASTAVLLVVQRGMRRLLPLAMLLRLSMLFPDQAPKRYKVAARAWSSRRLQQQLSRHRLSEGDDDASLTAASDVLALLASLAAHDPRTRGHCERVRSYNDLLAEELGLARADRDRLRWAALIHDIGKLKVSHQLLNKPSEPTATEWQILRAHPIRGAEIAAPLSGWLGPWAAAIEQHHERWDGTGYPHGRAGHDINLGARIVAVADAFEVMTSLRPYGRPVSAEKARVELATYAGTQFDPLVVRAFLNIAIGRLGKAMGLLVLLSQLPVLLLRPRFLEGVRAGGLAALGAAVTVAFVIGPATAPRDHGAGARVAAAATAPSSGIVPSTPDAGPPATSAKAGHTAARRAASPRSSVRLTSGGRAAPTGGVTQPRSPQPPTTGPGTTPPTTGTTPPTGTGTGAPPPVVGGRAHGRCAGNSGAGAGNGGSTGAHGGGHKKAPGKQPNPSAPGQHACG